jgi:hypothetical protein
MGRLQISVLSNLRASLPSLEGLGEVKMRKYTDYDSKLFLLLIRMYTPGSEKGIPEKLNYYQNIYRIGMLKNYLVSVGLLILTVTISFAQDYDLIVTTKNDSIACYIDSISGNKIYFRMRFTKKWIHTFYPEDKVLNYKQNAISKKDASFKRGSTYLIHPDSVILNRYNRNMIYGTGSYSLYNFSATLNFERIFYISENAAKTWSFRAGYGILNWNGKIALLTLNNLRGRGQNKFEMNIGATYINEPHSYGPHYFSFVLNAGYRRQSQNGKFIFRTGLGTPEGLYLSMGYSF